MVGFGCFAFLTRRMERFGGSMDLVHSPNALVPSTSRSTLDGSDSDGTPANYIRDEQITQYIQQLSGTNGQAAIAAERLFERAHVSNPRHAGHKVQMLREGAVPALAARLNPDVPEMTRYHVCSALSELAFQETRNCRAITSCPGLLKKLVGLLQPTAGRTQEDAARIINNCAAFCEEAVVLIVKCPGMVKALTALVVRDDMDARHIAVGAVNSLSRCAAARSTLVAGGVLPALCKVLEEHGGDGDRPAATHASAAMALANLTGDREAVEGAPGRTAGATERYLSSVKKLVVLLELSVLRRQWSGILFRPYSVLYPIHQLSRHPRNRQILVEAGLIPRLAVFLRGGSGGQASGTSRPGCDLELGLAVVENLADNSDCRHAMRTEGMVEALRRAAGGGDEGCGEDLRRRAAAAAESLVGEVVAVASALHSRLGDASPLRQLDESTLMLVCSYI